MADRVRDLGEGCFLYKTDLSRGYRQMRVDPNDWPLLCFTVEGKYYFDLCPPFGMRTSALMMQRMNEAVATIHESKGYISRPYIDDFGGAERTEDEARMALETLQGDFKELGLVEAQHKVFQPTTCMPWLGIWINTVEMTLSITDDKLQEIMRAVEDWRHAQSATMKQVHSGSTYQNIYKQDPQFSQRHACLWTCNSCGGVSG